MTNTSASGDQADESVADLIKQAYADEKLISTEKKSGDQTGLESR